MSARREGPPSSRRRARALAAELERRAQVWIPEWRPGDDGPADAAKALLAIAARFQSEVAQRLDRMPDKSFRGFLHWLGVTGRPGNAARIPLVFSLAQGSEPVLAEPPIQVQATPGETPVIFEVTTPLRIEPARLVAVIGADPAADKFFGPHPGLSALTPPTSAPDQWRLRAAAPPGATTVQLDPPEGLDPGVILIDAQSNRYRVVTAADGLVTIEPGIGTVEAGPAPMQGLAAADVLSRAAAFDPFGGAERNQQRHALYLGSTTGLNINLAAVIEVVGGELPNAGAWHFWGQDAGAAAVDWIELEARTSADGRLFLIKPPGAVALRDVGGVNTRWLRATRPGETLTRIDTISDLKLLVNCGRDVPDNLKDAFDALAPAPPSDIALEGIANTTPLVLDQPFLPFGREPRMFDAFYLGCAEAFSKHSAQVTLGFDLGGSFNSSLAAAIYAGGQEILAGAILNDGRLRLMDVSSAGAVTFRPAIQPTGTDGRPVTLARGQRPSAAFDGRTPYFCVSDGQEVWLWSPPTATNASGWTPLGAPASGTTDDVLLLLRVAAGGFVVYALNAGALYWRSAPADGTWVRMPVRVGSQEVRLARLAPIVTIGSIPSAPSVGDGLVAVATDGTLLAHDLGTWRAFEEVRADPRVYPLAVRRSNGTVGIVAKRQGADDRLIAIEAVPAPQPIELEATLVGQSFTFGPREGDDFAVFFATAESPSRKNIGLWTPFEPEQVFTRSEPALDSAAFIDAPLPIGEDRYLFPRDKGALGVGKLDSTAIVALEDKTPGFVAIVAGELAWGDEKHVVIHFSADENTRGEADRFVKITQILEFQDRDSGFYFGGAFPVSEDRTPCAIHRGLHADLKGRLKGNELTLAARDAGTKVGNLVFISWSRNAMLATVEAITTGADGKNRARLDRTETGDRNVEYRNVEAAERRDVLVRPALSFPRTAWDIVKQPFLWIEVDSPGLAQPRAGGRVSPLYVDENKGKIILDTSKWDIPQSTVRFTAVAVFPPVTTSQPVLGRNPDLSWEYWDGSAWWQIPGLVDNTGDLLRAGTVVFCVPANLQSASVQGRDNHWIRARLINGDYGQERVQIVPDPNDPKIQTVLRDLSELNPPYVSELTVSYSVCCPVAFARILTEDSGAIRDQTAANSARNAAVQIFTPLSLSLIPPVTRGGGGRTADESVASSSACHCRDDASGTTAPQADEDGAGSGERERALYLGFDRSLVGGPINLLFLLQDGVHDDAFPVVVEGFADGAFLPVTSEDETRGLNETGIVNLFLPRPLQQVQLFGQSLFWLRLKPRPGFAATEWKPRIRNAYLNAAWALAAETQTYELLGSSDGSPNLRTALARPPVVAGSLELRVRELMGEEEIEDLRALGDDRVGDPTIGGRPGPWVLWRQDDPAIAGPQDRVYALDAATGEIQFGDGLRGRIPPIGRDCLLAVRYQTGGNAAANGVRAWSQINLITAIQGVEATVTPEGAAGGADPQDAPTALRFAPANLALRSRALTLADLEHLALQSSPDIAQARALMRRGQVRLAVAVRGPDPRPSNAQRRELQRFLSALTPPDLAAPGALDVTAPRLVGCHLRIAAIVADLAFSGVVAREAIAKITALLDPAAGGHEKTGWRFGEMLTDTDLAAILSDLPHLEDVAAPVQIQRDDGRAGPLAPDQLVVISPQSIEIRCVISPSEVLG